ncbi:MAG TPA: plasmid pRiA4b ORF-3 family protein [Polyangia bacterium]
MPRRTKSPQDAGPHPGAVYQLKVTLRRIRPAIWRRVQVPGSTPFSTLHDVIQMVMGWEDDHQHAFTLPAATRRARAASIDERLPLEAVAGPRTRLLYEYDFGDGWEHDVLVEKVVAAEPGVRYPVCLGGARACPPEDCGGAYGYARLLEVRADKDHQDHEEAREWVGAGFDPEAFDHDAVSTALGRVRLRQPRAGEAHAAAAARALTREWVGGRVRAPFYITEGEPYRPELVLWLEVSSGLIVGSSAVRPEDPAEVVAAALAAAVQAPITGPPRRPELIRVADEALASAVRLALSGVPVTVAPTPELQEIVKALAQQAAAGDEPESYLEGGRVQRETVAALFAAASRLYQAAPWALIGDPDLVAFEAPHLGQPRACISVLGQLGESTGLLLFESIAGYRAMQDYAAEVEEGARDDDGALGASVLALNFERRADLPPPLAREIKAHAWKLAGSAAYPHPVALDPDGVLRPLADADVRLLAVVADAMAQYCARHRDGLATGRFGGATEQLTVQLGGEAHEVRVTAPHPEAPWDEEPNPYDGPPDEEDDDPFLDLD